MNNLSPTGERLGCLGLMGATSSLSELCNQHGADGVSALVRSCAKKKDSRSTSASVQVSC